jgi:zinc finger protein
VKADSALVKIPELDFEIPPTTQRGVITTVEGLLSRTINDLLKEQPNRKVILSTVE